MLAFGTERSTMRRPTGTIIAPPMPCTALATIRCSSECAVAQAREAVLGKPEAVYRANNALMSRLLNRWLADEGLLPDQLG